MRFLRRKRAAAVEAHLHPKAVEFRKQVVDQGEFEHDWFTVHIPVWEELLSPLEGRSARVLELGSFEGLSACYVLWRLPGARVTCVDTFDWFDIDDLEGRFDRNVALVDAGRVRRLTGVTREVLPRLIDAQEAFDFIYVDASHLALDVLADAAQAWKLLAPGGLVVFDDYGLDYDDPMLSPTRAIDAFAHVVASEAERVDAGGQYTLRKREDRRD
jgi:predicted O-methyltransferase YrrM